MSEPVIQVKNLSKVYNISHEQKASVGNATLVDVLSGVAKKPLELITGHKLDKEKFWALKDISFDIEKGDVVGIIGRNGSGKSTLLKVLSRIVEPTHGEIHMKGKVASLLEVGTGFHPELTGRENIFFNGAILGMSQKEIRAKFKEIVAFSGVENFLDTPVKFYSSGMYVRLAFAVAAHLDPDILIVDEVLAVGDAEFQKKSLGKMKNVAQQGGRTVIFVSHSMDAVRSICNKVAWFDSGKIKAFGDTDEIIAMYTSVDARDASVPLGERTDRQGTGYVKATDLRLYDTIQDDKRVDLELTIISKLEHNIDTFKLSIDINDMEGANISNIYNHSIGKKLVLKPGSNKFKIQINNVSLVPGEYSIAIFLAKDSRNTEIYDYIEDAAYLLIPQYDFHRVGFVPEYSGHIFYTDYKILENE